MPNNTEPQQQAPMTDVTDEVITQQPVSAPRSCRDHRKPMQLKLTEPSPFPKDTRASARDDNARRRGGRLRDLLWAMRLQRGVLLIVSLKRELSWGLHHRFSDSSSTVYFLSNEY